MLGANCDAVPNRAVPLPLPSARFLALQCRPVSGEGAWWIKSLGTS